MNHELVGTGLGRKAFIIRLPHKRRDGRKRKCAREHKREQFPAHGVNLKLNVELFKPLRLPALRPPLPHPRALLPPPKHRLSAPARAHLLRAAAR